MQIDPSQPIMFDSDSAPGKGTGMWQINPFFDNNVYHAPSNNQSPLEKRVRFWFTTSIALILLTAICHMILA
jgi:hypothetical protein